MLMSRFGFLIGETVSTVLPLPGHMGPTVTSSCLLGWDLPVYGVVFPDDCMIIFQLYGVVPGALALLEGTTSVVWA